MIIPLLAGPFGDVSPAKSAYVVAKTVDYLGTALFVGGAFFVAALWPAGSTEWRTRRVLGVGWVLGLLGTLAVIATEGAWAGQLPPSDALRWSTVQQVLSVQFGHVWAVKALLWVLAGVVLADLLQRGATAARSLAWRVGAVAVGVGLLRATGMTAHANESGTPLWTQLADLVHLTGMSLWVGGLVVLLLGVLPRRDPDELDTVARRYSTLALGSVLAIVGGGLVLAWQLLGSVDALLHSDYGQLLLIKLGGVLAVLFVAQLSKRWVRRRLDFAVALRGDAATVRPFVYSVAAETALLLIVLVAVGFLVTAHPGR